MAINSQKSNYIGGCNIMPVYIFSPVEMLSNLVDRFSNRPELIDAGILEDIQVLANDIASLPNIYNIVQIRSLIELLTDQINAVELNIQAIQDIVNNLWDIARTPPTTIVNTMMNVIDYPSDIEWSFNQKYSFNEVVDFELPVMFDFSSENSLFIKLTLIG